MGRRGRVVLRRGAGSAALVSIFTVAILAAAPPAIATAGFCESRVAFNYAQPLEEMPTLRSASAEEQLPFGPRGVRLYRGSESKVMVLGGTPGGVGFSLGIPRRSGKFAHPDLPPLNWLVTSKLARVDSSGRVTQQLGWRRRHITGPGNNGGFAIEFSGELGFYRFEIVFRNGAGKRLGRFGKYFRVLPAVSDARLTVDAVSYRLGETISACLENYGTTEVVHGICGFGVQSFNGSSWSGSSIDPPRPCPAVGVVLGPGRAENLDPFEIPADAPTGLYRAVAGGAASAGFWILSG